MKIVLYLILLSFVSFLHAGEDAIAIWTFDPSAPKLDSSDNKHDLTLRGQDTRFVADDRFGGALQIGNQNQPGDVKQGALAKPHETLNPLDAFTVELWVRPDAMQPEKPVRMVLIDKKYYFASQDHPDANKGYMISLRKLPTQKFFMEVDLGFGSHSELLKSEPVDLKDEEWSHLAFAYDGQGMVRFYVNHALINERKTKGKGSIAPSTFPLVIGDRHGSIGARFPGRIAKVKLSRGEQEIVSD